MIDPSPESHAIQEKPIVATKPRRRAMPQLTDGEDILMGFEVRIWTKGTKQCDPPSDGGSSGESATALDISYRITLVSGVVQNRIAHCWIGQHGSG